MTKRELINICKGLDGAYEDYPFDLITDAPNRAVKPLAVCKGEDSEAAQPAKEARSWTVMRHKGNRNGFAHIFERGGLCINLKANPSEGDLLRQTFKDITPAYHMNKEHWSTIKPNGDVPPEILQSMIENSYELTKPKEKRV